MTRLQRVRAVGPILLAAGLFLALTSVALAQRGFGFNAAARTGNPRYDGRFMFARLKYNCFGNCYYYYGQPSWAHGYPSAEENLMKIMDALTALHPHLEDSQAIAIDDPNLGKFPVAFMVEPSFWLTTDKAAAILGEYLKKGGFLIFDDFRNDFRRGSGGLANLEANLTRAIPGARLVQMNPTDQIFHVFFDINNFNIFPQYYDQGAPVILGLYEDNDPKKRLMAIINFNTDVSNFWEFSARGFAPVDSTNQAYKLGVNYIIYGLTH